jgi:hypothetical protein
MRYLLIAFVLFACKNPSGQKNSIKFSTEVLDTIKSTPPKIIAAPDLFETAFMKGTTQKGKSANANLYGITIGKIKVISGQIIACDPLHIDEYGKPFTQVFPTGEFPVQLSIAEVGGEETAAFARINFSDEPVVNWQLAVTEGQKPLPVDDEEIHGYSVDAGVGIFMDLESTKALDTKRIWDLESKHELFKEMDKHYHGGWRYTMYNFGQHNLAAFTTGIGDGRYATYIGFDATGKPCRLVTDFRLFDWKKK